MNFDNFSGENIWNIQLRSHLPFNIGITLYVQAIYIFTCVCRFFPHRPHAMIQFNLFPNRLPLLITFRCITTLTIGVFLMSGSLWDILRILYLHIIKANRRFSLGTIFCRGVYGSNSTRKKRSRNNKTPAPPSAGAGT